MGLQKQNAFITSVSVFLDFSFYCFVLWSYLCFHFCMFLVFVFWGLDSLYFFIVFFGGGEAL
jgi:hypothetical protein